MMTLEKLLKENTGLLSRMKERDGNDKLNKICEELFKEELKKERKEKCLRDFAIGYSQKE